MSNPSLPRFGIFKTESRVIHSDSVGQDYEVGVWLPFSYAHTDRAYPVLYVPDGEFAYPAVMGLMPTFMGNGEVPEMIVVGIAYHGISTWEEFGALRDSDFLPQQFQGPERQTRMAQFTRFFTDELFPLVEREYRASAAERALFGLSSAGFFTAQMAFNCPGLFRRLVAASCTWPGAGEYLVERAQSYAQQPVRPPLDLFLSAGGLEDEMLPGFNALTALLNHGSYPEIRLQAQVMEGEGHSAGMIAKTFLAGMKAVFK